MKKLLKNILAGTALLVTVGFTSVASAQDASAKAEAAPASAASAAASVVAAPASAPAAPVASAPAASASAPAAAADPAAASAAAAPAPVANKGDTAWMMVSTLLVILMTIPGLALFYGGLVRSKNMLSILLQVFMIFAVIIVLWFIYGYSLAFTEGGRFIVSFDRLFLNGIWLPAKATVATAATFSKGVVIPEFVYVGFQATFSAISCGLNTVSFA